MVRFHLFLELESGNQDEEFENFINGNESVVYAAMLDGNTEYSVTVECANTADMDTFVDEVKERFSLTKFKSSVVSRELKKSA